MLSFLFRVIGFLALAGGFAALVIDGTRSIAANEVVQTRIGDTLHWLSPLHFAAAEQTLKTAHAWLWTLLTAHVLVIPTWILLSVLAALLLTLGRPRPPRIGISSRR